MTEDSSRHSDPPTVRVDSLLARWRARLLRPILMVATAVATLNVAISSTQFFLQGSPGPALSSLSLLALMWCAALLRFRSGRMRIWLTLAVLYGAATLALVTMGLGAGGVMAVFGFVSLSALLLGARGAVYAFALAALTMTAVALGFHWRFLHVSDPSILDAQNLTNWLRVGSFGACILAGVGGISISLLRVLTRTLEERGALVQKLRDEVRERERANLALAEAQQRLIHAHKLEAVGRLAGGIAHDFNNTLTVILSYSELLKRRLAGDRQGGDLADQITRAAEQGSDLTKQLLTFSRRQLVKPRNVDVQQAMQRTERAMGRLSSGKIRIHRVEVDDELCVRIDPTQLEQALLNLTINARDAMPDGGDIYLEAKSIILTMDSGVPLLPGPYVVLRVRDTGAGMSEDVLARAFEPFFTTKDPGLGTGLGLSNVREATDAAGGYVSVTSELGQGTEFSLYFPRTDARVSGIEARDHELAAKPASVLVVDDEPQIREVIQAILVEAGYEVHAANGAKHALEMARLRRFDLLWADLVMPDLAGGKLIEEFLLLRPGTPVLVCSAYNSDDSIRARVARGDLAFLPKPFTRKVLLDVVGRALSSARQVAPERDGEIPPPRVAG